MIRELVRHAARGAVSGIIAGIVASAIVVAVFLTICSLTGCVPPGMNIAGPGMNIEGPSHKPQDMKDGTCMFEGQVVMTSGTELKCGKVADGKAANTGPDPAEAAAPPTTEQSPDSPAAATGRAAQADDVDPATRDPPAGEPQPDLPPTGEPQAPAPPATPAPVTEPAPLPTVQDPAGNPGVAPPPGADEAGPVEPDPIEPDPVEPDPPGHMFAPDFGIEAEAAVPEEDFDLHAEIRRDEGGQNLLYCDSSGAHIGDGHKIILSDPERDALLCVDVANAEAQAERVIGAFYWASLDEVRKDVWIVVCYWSICSGFDKALHATRIGDYAEAGRELLRNKAGDGPSEILKKHADRARKYARWMETGKRE